ncbi:hypothetical protein BCR35DRAFT_310806 [Leucosporidium creatinivorum]|uniref:WW domain-containing protein n=1 Tax=Leucosporidium creatinivorum TaxID=106004 RepID=A0A1Y2CQQ6_9BASI|nr:hypothetical protein BCR35DRAFT_310806 [Leucosporidium creatinivorum]
MESNEVHLHPLDWPLFPLEELTPLQLALAAHHPDFDDEEQPYLPLEVYRLWTRLRERARNAGPPTEDELDYHHRIDLSFELSLNSLNNLSSEQLLAVPFHPEATPAIEARAQKAWRRRRERDLAAGKRYSRTAPVAELRPHLAAEIKPTLPIPSSAEDVQSPSPSLPPAPRLPDPPAPEPIVARSPSPPPPTARPSPPPLPPLPSNDTRLPPHLASLLHTLRLTNLPPTLKSAADLRAIFKSALRPDTVALVRAQYSEDGVALPREGFAAWLDFDARTNAMQAAVLMRLGTERRWVPSVEFVESARADWGWGELDREYKEAFWRKEMGLDDVSNPREASAPATVEPEAALPPPPRPPLARSPSLPSLSPAPEVESGTPPLPPQPEQPPISTTLTGPAASNAANDVALPSSTPADLPSPASAAQTAAERDPSPVAHIASPAPSDTTPAGSPLPPDPTPIPPSVVKTWHQLTYLTQKGVRCKAIGAVGGLSCLNGCIGALSLTTSSLHGTVQYAAFLKSIDRDRAVKTLQTKGLGSMLDPKVGTLEGWSRSNLTSKFRKGEQAARAKAARALESRKRDREDEGGEADGGTSGEVSSKQARLDSGVVADSSLDAGAHQRMETPQDPPSSRANGSTASLASSSFSTSIAPDLTSPALIPDSTSPAVGFGASFDSRASLTPSDDFDPFVDALGRPLPNDWRREKSRSTGDYFYSRDYDGFTAWENPLDGIVEADRVEQGEAQKDRMEEEEVQADRIDEEEVQEDRMEEEEVQADRIEEEAQADTTETGGVETDRIEQVRVEEDDRTNKDPTEPLSDVIIDDDDDEGDDEGVAADPSAMDVSQLADTDGDLSPAPRGSSLDPPTVTATSSAPLVSVAPLRATEEPSASVAAPAPGASAAAPISFRLPQPTSTAAPLPSTSTSTATTARAIASRLSSSPAPPSAPAAFSVAAPVLRSNPQPTLAARTAPPIDIRGLATPQSSATSSFNPPRGPASSLSAPTPLADRLGGQKSSTGASNSTRGSTFNSSTGSPSLLNRLDGSLPKGPSKKAPSSHPPTTPANSLQARIQQPPSRPPAPSASSSSLLERARLPSRSHAPSQYQRSPPRQNDRYAQPSPRSRSPPRGPRYAPVPAQGGGRGGGSLGRHSIEDARRGSGGGRGGQGGGGNLLGRLGRSW